MSRSSTSSSISLAPDLPAYVTARARQLNFKRNTYLAALLSNFLHGPRFKLPQPEAPDQKLIRSIMTVTMPDSLRREGQKAAARHSLSFSALMESLVIQDASRDTGDDTLTLHPVRTAPSPRLRRLQSPTRPPAKP